MNQLVISLMVILLPGILATVICEQITTHSKLGYFKFSVYSILLGWLSYVGLQIFTTIIPNSIFYDPFPLSWSFKTLNVWYILFEIANTNDTESYMDLYMEIGFASIVSIFVAFMASAFVNYQILNRIARRFKISTKYGDENLFSYYLNSDEIQWVYIRDQSRNLTYRGKISKFSEAEGIQEIVLSYVDVYRYEDSEHLYSINNVYLSMKIGEFTIEEAINNDKEKLL